MSLTQSHTLEEKLDLSKKEFNANVKLVQDLLAIFQLRLDIEQQYLNGYQKLSKMVENFNKSFISFCPDLFSPFESFHAIQLDQKQKLVHSLETDLVQHMKAQSGYIFSLEQNLYMNCKSIIDSYNQLFLDIPKLKNEYLSTREELSSSWESLNSAQMSSNSLKTIEKFQKKFQLARQKKEEKMDSMHQKLKNLRHCNRFYSEMENELEAKYDNFECQKSDLVFDSISKYFVQEVHYMTSLQYDFNNILKKLNDEEGKEKIKLIRYSQIDQQNLPAQQSPTENQKPFGQTFNQFLEGDAANKLKLKAMDFIKKMSSQPKEKGIVIGFQANELDGFLHDEWKCVLKEMQEREAKKQKQIEEEIQKQQELQNKDEKQKGLEENNNSSSNNQQQKKEKELEEKNQNQSDSSENSSYQYFDQQEINQALD
ncbi:hypothetical protein TTHERM_00971650 (macronuclear) [Tetrahymena thermophila SB210]|uniref:F-BAR domain-containing protein n=1 Tax=Tetrahymena thermophila (strain SB210) TaxID=312017 RepID=Q24DK7_TETTS|nr:hypothetical protein TTHERM_00971650 [Tetrahymena thermophila SB210]EAS05841.2 hypothetical protein TTHERM_00971650 [Tetrahymena thermophila SB210]|eukprot:XP_001026086.2 hypothetical protein TTHERM_00971650 [Tetrahymena thermophila SB210]